jgi:hypothetical protein
LITCVERKGHPIIGLGLNRSSPGHGQEYHEDVLWWNQAFLSMQALQRTANHVSLVYVRINRGFVTVVHHAQVEVEANYTNLGSRIWQHKNSLTTAVI